MTGLEKKNNLLVKPTENEKSLAMITHILAIFTVFIGPLIVWLMKKDDSPFIAVHSKNALNFQLSLMIYLFVSSILILVLIGFFLLPILSALNIIFCIIGAVKASNGSLFEYPITIPFIR